jgi:hypothetical protein
VCLTASLLANPVAQFSLPSQLQVLVQPAPDKKMAFFSPLAFFQSIHTF